MLEYFARTKAKKRHSLDVNQAELGRGKDKSKVKCVRFSVPFEPPRKPGGHLLKEIKCLQRATSEDYLYTGSFHEAIASVLVMAQCFAMMPVVGVKGKTASDLQFSWKAVRTIYSLIAFVLTTVYASLALYMTFRDNVEFDLVVNLMFFTSGVYGILSFFFLAMKWPALMVEWEKVESSLPKLRSLNDKRKLAHQVQMLTIVMMCLSLSEHILSIISTIHNSNRCLTAKAMDPIKEFFLKQMFEMWQFTEYAPWKAFFGKCLNVMSTFIWTYMDVFVMVISAGLSNRFAILSDDLMRVKGKHMPQEFWSTRRRQYRNLCALCESVDGAISKITVFSFSNNLFFVCVQLLRSLRPMPSFAHAFYFWFSLTFLIGRTLAVCLYAAQIYDQSKIPIKVLRAVPNESWCLDVQRFSEEVINHTAALSGMRFFYLTRKLVLSVTGTIATYELVLIQFHQNDTVVDHGC